jgi:AraC-like DNA-binding protein
MEKTGTLSKGLKGKGVLLAKRMCENIKDQLVISAEVNTLYTNENQNAEIDTELIRALKPEEEHFLTEVMSHIELNWSEPSFNADSFSRDLGYSKSFLYRRLIRLTGKAPSNFIKEFRLHKALMLLHDQKGSIAEVAIKTGFKSSSYFSKCFFDKYSILPSKYIQQHT